MKYSHAQPNVSVLGRYYMYLPVLGRLKARKTASLRRHLFALGMRDTLELRAGSDTSEIIREFISLLSRRIGVPYNEMKLYSFDCHRQN